jgi:hypothetical protein
MKLSSECIYEHRDHGEVLVCGIHTEYKSYETTKEEGVEVGTFVRYADEWDGYGSMPGSDTKVPVDEFIEAAGTRIRTFNRITECEV